MATSSSVILLIVAGSFLGAAYGGDKLHVPPAQDISSFTFQLRTIYGNSTLSNGSLHSNMTEDDDGPRTMTVLPDADNNLNIYALPVGQGDCTIIQCPRAHGGRITIIDAGSGRVTGFTQHHLINFLRLDEVTIQYIFLTHPDLDHINYIDAILNAYGRNVPVYHSCGWQPHYNHLVTSQHANPKTRVPSCCGQNCIQRFPPITLCEGGNQGNEDDVILRVIGSEYTGNNCTPNHKNEDSIVSIIKYGEVKTLITGDFEGSAAFVQNFINCPGNDLSADIYRLSSHGADNGNANRRNFLTAINARYVFSSSGFLHGHPRCELYDYYINGARLAVVQEHTYTCQNVIPRNERRRRNLPMYQRVPHQTRRAIYVTTVDNDENYVIQFKINNRGRIDSSARQVHV